jgi:hypothetical protein
MASNNNPMSETQPNHEFDDFVFIIFAYNSTLDWPEREPLLVHYSVNYLLNHGIPGTRITVLANDLSVCSWANQQGMKFIQLKATDRETVMEAMASVMQENPWKNIICLNTVFPVREADLLSLMCSQIRTEKQRLFLTAHMGAHHQKEDNTVTWDTVLNGSILGFRHDSDIKSIFHPDTLYPVHHNAECGNYNICYRYQYMKEPLESAVAVGYKMSAWTAPCPSEYPRRVEIKLDKDTATH